MPRGFQQRLDRAVELVAPGQRAGRQPLHDDEVAVAIDGDAGQPFALAREHAHRLRAGPRRTAAAAAQPRARSARRSCRVPGATSVVGIAREHAHRDRVVLIDVAAADEVAVAGEQLDDGAGLLGDAARRPTRRETPTDDLRGPARRCRWECGIALRGLSRWGLGRAGSSSRRGTIEIAAPTVKGPTRQRRVLDFPAKT